MHARLRMSKKSCIFAPDLCSEEHSTDKQLKNYIGIMANEKPQSGLMFNALTAGSKIVGNISADSDFRIDGLIEGDLNCTGKVVIGEAGRIKGTVVCQQAEILGLMEGKIVCHQQLSLRASGKIQGDVQTKTLIVEPGALFNGTCSMGAAKPVAAKEA